MEAEVLDASNPFPPEGDNPILDSDLYGADGFDIPDPGLLTEKNELSDFTAPPQELRTLTRSQRWQNMNLRARARQLWLLLRTGLHDIVEKEKRAELRVARLTHGLEPLRCLEVAAGLRSVAQDPVGGRFVVLDGAGCLHLHREDGWAQEKLPAPVALSGLVTVLGPLGAVGRFVGWGPSGLAILGPDFSLLWLSEPGVGRAPGREPTCCLPVPYPGLLLVAEVGGGLELWKFRSGGRRLVPRGSRMRPTPNLAGPLMRLALGPAPPHRVPRCFAACGSAVLSFDLQAWALLDVHRDLHKTTISDLAYCEGADAMVTASRDSTVKVWEADWQIRMVFVGHTGPVTALAVLPDTTLVVSASQDGTLRTWDLQAAAQVGEVALCYWSQDVLSGRVSRLLAPARPGWPVLSLRASSVELWRVRELYSQLAQLPAPVLHLQAAPALPAPAHPPLPVRLACACADGSVYLVSAVTGRTVSALLLEPDDPAAAVAYCLPRESLWLLTRAGHLVRANAARCPMRVLHRVRPPPPPAPRPCCLHLYSHLTDPGSACASWATVRQHGGEPRHSAVARPWEDKNRYLPVLGYTDGSLSVLEWRSSETVFCTEAHSPGPVTAVASTWNSVVSSGGDLTVKVWRVFPYTEESLSLLRTFSCCHPVVTLCALGTRVTIGFEDQDSATYGLVQFGLGNSQRCDHRPQDDPMDHITGLCCCPTLELCACSSLDCTVRIWTAENRLLRLLQLDGAPQALAFCSNSGDLVLALGSRLCLVSHSLYLPTSYLVKKLCQETPDVLDDPPLPLTSQESLTSAQLQRLANLHRAASLRSAGRPAQPSWRHPPQDLEALVARDRDLQQLKLGLVVPEARPPLSWQQCQEAFDNYLRLIYGPGLLGVQSGRESQPCSTMTLKLLARSSLSYDLGLSLDLQLQSRRLRGEAPVALDLPSSYLQHRIPLLLKRQPKEALSNLGGFFPATTQPHKHCSRPVSFPGCVPNSMVLQQMWLPAEVGRLGSLAQLGTRKRLKQGWNQDDLWLQHPRQFHTHWQRKLIQWLGALPGEEEEEAAEQLDLDVDWVSESLSPHRSDSDQQLDSREPEAQASADLTLEPPRSYEAASTKSFHPQDQYRHSLWEECYGHLPSFLQFFVIQDWFKKLFPIFTLQAYPEAGTVEGLASLLVELLEEASWADRVHILHALLGLLPDVGSNFCVRLQGILVHLLNMDQPPSLQDRTQKQFVMLALQLLLACSLESHDVVLELMSYLLYSPAVCWPDLKKLLDGLGLQDPQGFLFKEMMTWVQGLDLDSKDALRKRCCQKLEDMIQQLQVEISQPLSPGVAKLSVVLPNVSETSEVSSTAKEAPSEASLVAGVPAHVSMTPSGPSWPPLSISKTLSHVLEVPSLVTWPDLATPDSAALELQAEQLLVPACAQQTRRTLCETLQTFCFVPDAHLGPLVPSTLPGRPLPLEKTDWSQSQMVDLGLIDALNLFCERQAQQQGLLQEAEPKHSHPQLHLPVPNTVVPPPRDRWRYPILRLQEVKVQRSGMRLRGRMPSRLRTGGALDGPVRTLKLPLPRVALQPFPPDWPRPARPLPPLLLEPTLQRYFLLDHTDPDSCS